MAALPVAAIAMYASIAAAGVSAAAAVRQGNMSKNLAEANAEEDRKRAGIERGVAVSREEASRQHAREVIGRQLASGSVSGVQLSGSSLNLVRQSMFESEMDALNIRYGGELNASGLERSASLTRWQGQQQQNGGYLSAAGSIIGGAAGAYGMRSSTPGTTGVSDFRLGEIRSYGQG